MFWNAQQQREPYDLKFCRPVRKPTKNYFEPDNLLLERRANICCQINSGALSGALVFKPAARTVVAQSSSLLLSQ